MKTNLLLPYRFKKPGWFLLVFGMLLFLIALFFGEDPEFLNIKTFAFVAKAISFSNNDTATYFKIINNNVFDEIIGLLVIVGGVFVAFSKNKVEDEFIAKLRLDSLMWATYINYAILLFSILFIYEISFFYVLVVNMFTILLLFIIRFNWIMVRSTKLDENEE